MLLGTLGHSVGWPLAQGGSQTITDALAKLFIQAGGQIRCGERVSSLRQLPPARAVLCDITPMQLVALAGEQQAAMQQQLGAELATLADKLGGWALQARFAQAQLLDQAQQPVATAGGTGGTAGGRP